MPNQSDLDQRRADIAKIKGVRDSLIGEIMSVTEDVNPFEELDPSNPFQLVRTEIYYYFSAHAGNPLNERVPLLTLGEIAEIVIPDIYQTNGTVAKEVVSAVGKAMYRKDLELNMNTKPELYPLFETPEERASYLDERVLNFNRQRNSLVRQRQLEERMQTDPDYFKRLSQAGREAQNQRSWTPEEIARVEELAASILWPEGTKNAGKTNWGKVAEILGEELGEDFDRIYIKKSVESRHRKAKKRLQ